MRAASRRQNGMPTTQHSVISIDYDGNQLTASGIGTRVGLNGHLCDRYLFGFWREFIVITTTIDGDAVETQVQRLSYAQVRQIFS